jgi:PAS domain S-box-containing protein
MFQVDTTKLRSYTLLTGLGFIVVIVLELMFYGSFYSVIEGQNASTFETYNRYVTGFHLENLRDMARHIAQKYPALRDPDRLRREGQAGTAWFWATSAEWKDMAETFGFAWIYVMEKTGGEYRFLMSSGIAADNHPEWLGSLVWQGDRPEYTDEAWESGEMRVSPEPVINEWGALIEAALPIVVDGVTVAMLGVAYDISSFQHMVDEWTEQAAEQQRSLRGRMGSLISLTVIFTLIIMVVQIILSSKMVLVPTKTAEAEEHIHAIMDSNPITCSLFEADGTILYNNDKQHNLFKFLFPPGYSIRNFSELLDALPATQPDGSSTKERALSQMRLALETGSADFEWFHVQAAGEPIPMQTLIVRIPWNGGFRLAMYSRDLREIKAKEAAILEIGERLRAMLDTMAFACFFFDESFNPIDCNLRALELYRAQSKEDFLNNFFTVYSPEFQPDGRRSAERAKEELYKALKNGKSMFRWEHRTADRRRLPTEITLIRVAWNKGFRLVAWARDLSGLMETEDNLQRILCVVEGSPNFLMYISADGDIEYMNPAVSYVTGFTKEELIADGLERIFSAEDFQRLGTEYIAAALENNRMMNFEMGVFTKTGGQRDFAFSAFAAHLHGGQAGVGILGRDITDLKRVQRDLIAAKEQAERALALGAYYSQAKSDFLSRVSHEMRTPLNIIIGMTDLARKAFGKDEREQSLGKIEEASHRLLDIVNDILDMTSLDTGGFDWTIQPFSFTLAMNQVIEAAAAKADVKRQRFVTSLDQSIPDILVSDEQRLKQTLSRLLSNAVKFTAEGGTVSLSAANIAEEDNECLVRFEVSDTGIGISKEAQERLWDIFEQGDNSITRSHGGMGLGLPLTKRIVELMKGTIRLESEPGKGSRFICDVRLGIHRMEAEQKDFAPPPAPVRVDLQGLRVLVVDDEEINREILCAMLGDAGAEYAGAANGAEAVSMFSQAKYDLVLMDLHMPVMNGLDAAREIRDSQQPWAKTTPIISVSADTGADIHSKCLAAGINGHIAKPVNMELLFHEILKWLPYGGRALT